MYSVIGNSVTQLKLYFEVVNTFKLNYNEGMFNNVKIKKI